VVNQTPIKLAKKSGRAYIDSYEKALQRVLDFERPRPAAAGCPG
jgi:hypothetical protein